MAILFEYKLYWFASQCQHVILLPPGDNPTAVNKYYYYYYYYVKITRMTLAGGGVGKCRPLLTEDTGVVPGSVPGWWRRFLYR
jgi:hypothetical protein